MWAWVGQTILQLALPAGVGGRPDGTLAGLGHSLSLREFSEPLPLHAVLRGVSGRKTGLFTRLRAAKSTKQEEPSDFFLRLGAVTL